MAFDDFFGASGDDVVGVNPGDLRNIWAMMRHMKAHTTEGQHPALDAKAYENVCSPGANVAVVWYRASMLGVMQLLPEAPLGPWLHDGEFDDAVFQIAATFPMKKLGVGVVHDELPFDVREFLKRLVETSGEQK
jgi:hypothetical protein